MGNAVNGLSSSNLVTTVDSGQLHVALDEKFQGRINSYNNCFTKFFAKIFGWSLRVQMENRFYDVEKESYREFLKSGQIHDPITTATNFDSLVGRFQVIGNKGFMRHAISKEKADRLGRELLGAQLNNDVTRAGSLARKGANIDSMVWQRQNDGRAFFTPELGDSLPLKSLAPEPYHKYTPHLLAARKGQTDLLNLFLRYGVNAQQTGEICLFQRDIVQTQQTSGLEFVERRQIVQKGGHHGRPGRLEVRNRLGADAVSTTTTRFQDTRTHRFELQFFNGAVLENALPPDATVVTFKDSVERQRVAVF